MVPEEDDVSWLAALIQAPGHCLVTADGRQESLAADAWNDLVQQVGRILGASGTDGGTGGGPDTGGELGPMPDPNGLTGTSPDPGTDLGPMPDPNG
jgi:hypothetical protein